MGKKCIFVLGGARSGKSYFAQELAGSISDKVMFVATAEALDEEMKARIKEHQRMRPGSWQTLETPANLAAGITDRICHAEVVLIDCLSLLVSNLMFGEGRGFSELNEINSKDAENRVIEEINTLIELMQKAKASFIIVSNEVGLGLVPDNVPGRVYRDLLGRTNQIVAQHADEVYLLVAGIPFKAKG